MHSALSLLKALSAVDRALGGELGCLVGARVIGEQGHEVHLGRHVQVDRFLRRLERAMLPRWDMAVPINENPDIEHLASGGNFDLLGLPVLIVLCPHGVRMPVFTGQMPAFLESMAREEIGFLVRVHGSDVKSDCLFEAASVRLAAVQAKRDGIIETQAIGVRIDETKVPQLSSFYQESIASSQLAE